VATVYSPPAPAQARLVAVAELELPERGGVALSCFMDTHRDTTILSAFGCGPHEEFESAPCLPQASGRQRRDFADECSSPMSVPCAANCQGQAVGRPNQLSSRQIGAT